MVSLTIVSFAEVASILRRNRGPREHRLQVWCRWEDTYSPGNWASGNPALTIARGACGTSTYTPSADHRFPQQALFPSVFRLQVGWVLQEPPSEFFLAQPGIPSSATRRTRKVSWAAKDVSILLEMLAMSVPASTREGARLVKETKNRALVGQPAIEVP
jgi:hypothetical protein